MIVVKRVIENGKQCLQTVKECNTYTDIADVMDAFSREKYNSNPTPYKSYDVIGPFFDICLCYETLNISRLMRMFRSWKEQNNLQNSSIIQVKYYLLRGYSIDEASEIVANIQADRSDSKNPETMKKIVSTKRQKNLYSYKQQARGRAFYRTKGFTEEEIERIVACRNSKWLESMKAAINIDPTINKRKGRTREQLIEKYGYTKAEEIIASRLLGSPSKPERLLGDILSSDWESQWAISYKNRCYLFDYVNHKAKLVLEFNGDIWHANPTLFTETWINPVSRKTAKEIWSYDKKKEQAANSSGYRVVVLWEREIKELGYNKEEVKNKLYEITQNNI